MLQTNSSFITLRGSFLAPCIRIKFITSNFSVPKICYLLIKSATINSCHIQYVSTEAKWNYTGGHGLFRLASVSQANLIIHNFSNVLAGFLKFYRGNHEKLIGISSAYLFSVKNHLKFFVSLNWFLSKSTNKVIQIFS